MYGAHHGIASQQRLDAIKLSKAQNSSNDGATDAILSAYIIV